MNELDWIVGHTFRSLKRREHDWILLFSNDVTLVIECLWRLLDAGRIRITSEDDRQQFGLPRPLDAPAIVNKRLTEARVEGLSLRAGTLDLELTFGTGAIFQIIPASSGYEAWQLRHHGREFIANGGGRLVVDDGHSSINLDT